MSEKRDDNPPEQPVTPPPKAVIPTSTGSPAEAYATAVNAAEQGVSAPNTSPSSEKEQPASTPDKEVTFEKALEPVAQRMQRVKLPRDFVRGLLKPDAEIHLTQVSMQWAGMPNKNERAAMQEVLQALTAGGFLRQIGTNSWIVIHPLEQ